MASAQNLQIWSRSASAFIPLRQVVSGFETVFEDEIIQRKDRKRTIIVHADQRTGAASELFKRTRPKIEMRWPVRSQPELGTARGRGEGGCGIAGA